MNKTVTKQLVEAIQEGYRGIYTVDIKKDVEKMVQSLKEGCNRLH